MRSTFTRFTTQALALLIGAGALAFVLVLPVHAVDADVLHPDGATAIQPAERC